MPRVRRTSIISEDTQQRLSKGRPKLWSFSYTDFATLFHMNENALRQAVFKGAVDLADLESICRFWLKRRQRHPAIPELPQ
jgi:hypothetical protein